MKQWIPLILAFALLIGGCSTGNKETEPPLTPETTQTPAEETVATTIPVTTTSSVEETVPQPATVATEAPVEETEIVLQPYLILVEDPETSVHEKPEFRSARTAFLDTAGVYAIVDKATDIDGNQWGKLESGLGWVCMTTPPLFPIFAEYAQPDTVSDLQWHCGESEYVTDMIFTANESIRDVRFSLLEILPENWEYQESTILYSTDTLDINQTLKVSVVFWGDFTTYGLSFTDEDGNRRTYALMISGKDGSLEWSEYTN